MRRESEPLERLHVMLYSADVDRLRTLYGSTVGVSIAIRKMVRMSLKRIEEKHAEKRKHLSIQEGDLDDDE